MSLMPRIILESQVTPQSGALQRENLYKVVVPSSVPTISLFAISTRNEHAYCVKDTALHKFLYPIPIILLTAMSAHAHQGSAHSR